MKKGTGYRLVENILKINSFFSSDERQVEVIILSKNNAATSLRITNAINDLKLDIIRSAWTSGTNISNYLKAFKVDLFLSADDNDVLIRVFDQVTSNISASQASVSFIHDGSLSLPANQSSIGFDIKPAQNCQTNEQRHLTIEGSGHVDFSLTTCS